jgi:hypothetical protein
MFYICFSVIDRFIVVCLTNHLNFYQLLDFYLLLVIVLRMFSAYGTGLGFIAFILMFVNIRIFMGFKFIKIVLFLKIIRRIFYYPWINYNGQWSIITTFYLLFIYRSISYLVDIFFIIFQLHYGLIFLKYRIVVFRNIWGLKIYFL